MKYFFKKIKRTVLSVSAVYIEGDPSASVHVLPVSLAHNVPSLPKEQEETLLYGLK